MLSQNGNTQIKVFNKTWRKENGKVFKYAIFNILKFGVIHSLPHQTSHLDCVRPVNNNIVIVMDPNFERVDEGEFIVDIPRPQQHHEPV